MATEGRLRRDLSWPVPAEDLQDLDVIEIVHGEDGQVLWRVENRPAATPQDCHEVLMRHRHFDEPADLAGVPLNEVALEVPAPLASAASPDVAAPPFPADESSHIPELSELPVLQEFPQPPEVPELAALAALAGEPDMPLMLEAPEFRDADMSLQLRENVEPADVRELPPLETLANDAAPPSPHGLPELPEQAWVGLGEPALPRVELPAIVELPEPEVAELPHSVDVPHIEEEPQVEELPQIPELAALLALTDMPDVPLAMQTTELLDVATVLPLRENAELVDVPVVAQVEAAEDAPAVAEIPELPELPELAWAGLGEPALPRVELPAIVELPEPEVAELQRVVDMPHVEEEPQAEEPQIPEMAALLALSDMPDVPLAFQPRELLDVATVVPLHEDAEFVDVPAVAQVEAAEDGPTVSEVPDVPELPALAALAAFVDTPDPPTVLQAQDVPEMATALLNQEPVEFLDAPPLVPFWAPAASAVPSPHELPALPELAEAAARAEVPDLPPTLQAPDFLDVATALQLRENLEFLDVPVLHVFHASPEVRALLAHELPASDEWPQAEEVQQAAELPQVVASRRPEWSQARELALAREWPQAVEFVEVLQGPALTQAGERSVVQEESDVHASATVAEPARDVVAAYAHTWVTAALATLSRSRVGPAERLALVGGGMLMGVFFMIVGAPRVPATANVAATGSTVAQLTSPAPTSAEPAGAVAGQPRMVPASRTVNTHVPPFPITIPAETVPGIVTSNAQRPRPQAAPAVLGAVQRYTAAYNRQDARATKAVWPSADRQALVKTFSGLREQRLTLLSCTTAVTGNQATANCYGTRRYRPRVGDSSTRFQQGRWRFGLQRTGGTWLIASVDAPTG